MATTTIERTCPACNGTGGEGGKKTVDLSDFVSGGGLCSVCKGKGKVFETIHIKEKPTNPTYSSPSSTSRPTSSSSDDGGGCLAIIFLVIMVFVLIIMGYVVVYALILAPILIIAGMLLSGWHSGPKWMKLIWPLTFFIIPWVLLDWGVGTILNNLDQENFSLGTFGPNTLVILRDVYLVLGIIAVAVIIWDVVVPFVRQRVDISSGKIKFINSSTLTESTSLSLKRVNKSELPYNISGQELKKQYKPTISYFGANKLPNETLGEFTERCIKNRGKSKEDEIFADNILDMLKGLMELKKGKK